MQAKCAQSQKSIRIKLSLAYYAIAALMIGAVALLSVEKMLSNNEFGWLGFLIFTILLMSPPVLLVPYQINADKKNFTLLFRTGKKITVTKSGLTRVDQTWDRFLSHGFASHWSGVVQIRNNTELNKFIKKQIQYK